jgi:hypothetical protein
MTSTVTTIRVHIGRLTIDAAALGGSSRAQFAESLRQEIVQRLTGQPHSQQGRPVDLVAGQVASRITASAGLPRGGRFSCHGSTQRDTRR